MLSVNGEESGCRGTWVDRGSLRTDGAMAGCPKLVRRIAKRQSCDDD